MPIYEYSCGDCRRKVSVFFGSFGVAERRAEAGDIECPRCGSKKLTRLMSKSWMIRGGGGDDGSYDGMDDDMGGMGSMGGMGGAGDMSGMEGMFDGLDEEDPKSVARWARKMQENMGGMDMGPEFDQALSRIEAGEDPDKVMEDVDPEALGVPSGMGGIGGGGDDDDVDFSDIG